MSEDSEVKVATSGYADMKIGKGGWKVGYATLVGGSLFYYKLITDQVPKGSVELKGCKINPDGKPNDKKKFAVYVETSEGKLEIALQFGAKNEKDSWVTALQTATTLDSCEAPSKDGTAKKKKQTVGMGMQKGIASATADSGVGKAIMKKIVNEETTTLINALKALVTSESSEKKAKELEENIVKIAVKAYLLVDNKYLKGEQFLVADKPLRDAFNLLVKVFNGRTRAKKERVIEALQKVEGFLKQAEKVITDLLGPHLSGKNMMKLGSIFGTVANLKFLESVFYNDDVSAELEKLIDAMDYYTQFHYT